jgi:serine/threonine-protein kinase
MNITQTVHFLISLSCDEETGKAVGERHGYIAAVVLGPEVLLANRPIIATLPVALAPGTRLGPYEVIAQIGVGGMGEVYRARDTRLKREVAIKVLPDLLAGDPERLSRFQREAELLATLNHPNIAAIYGLEESERGRAIVLELVEGDTLADAIARAPIAVDDALRTARQIVEALEAAHDRGVIHRDLKPANIKITADGKVKVLDFGLAKMLESPNAPPITSMSPTMSVQATYAGVILGTAAYMSPEQARGKLVDRRTDVWAFGCVLFEMLTGTRAFDSTGDTVSDAVAAVLMKEPDWTLLPASTPPHIASLLRRCLKKDVQKRVPHIGVARLEIEEGAASPPPAVAIMPAASPLWRRAMPIAIGVLLTAAVAAAAWWRLKPDTPQAIVSRFVVTLPGGQNFTNTGRHAIAISPDGTSIVYTADSRLYLRTMGDVEARPIPGIDASYTVINPVFSPDGRSIVFYAGGGGAQATIKRIAASGGAPVTLGSFPVPIGMSWGPDGILLGQPKGIVRLSDNGGTPEVIVTINPDEVAHGPQMLPGGKAVLFTLAKARGDERWETADIVVQPLPAGPRKTIVHGGTDARYLSTGHLVYALSGVVFAVPLDLQRLQVSGGAVPIIEGVRRAPVNATGAAQFSVSANGSLVYMPGPVVTSTSSRELAIFDRTGKASALRVSPAAFEHARSSPDGKRVAFVTDDEKETVVWTYELSGARATQRLTFNGRNRFPIWTADGQRIAFQSDREGDRGIFWQRADGAGTAERLTTAEKGTEHIPESWSPKDDGFLYRMNKGGVNRLVFFSLKDRKSTPFGGVETEWPTDAVFSPDGRWVAYSGGKRPPGSINVGRTIYVQPFPATGPTYQLPVVVSTAGYRHPRWSPDGKELLFMVGSSGIRLMVAGVTAQPAFAFGNSLPLSKPVYWMDNATDTARLWDVLPDGQHFVAVIPAGSIGQSGGTADPQEYRVVLNWFEELKQRVPSK